MLNECGGLPASLRGSGGTSPPSVPTQDRHEVLPSVLGQDRLLCPHGWSWGVSISSQAVGRVAVKVTGDVGGCSPDSRPVPVLACHWPEFTSFDLSLPHCSLIAPVRRLPPLALLNLYPTCPRPLGPTVPYREAHGPPWCRGTTVFPPSVVPWPLEPLSVLGWGSWASCLVHIRSLSSSETSKAQTLPSASCCQEWE